MTRLIPAARAPATLSLTGYAPGTPEPPDGTASVGDLWRILWRRRAMIVSTAAVLVVATMIYGAVAPPLYTASSEIIIDPRDRQVMVNDVNPSSVAPDGGVTQIESQARVVESSGVLLRAIAATHLTDDPEFSGSGWLARLAALAGAGPRDPPSAAALQARTLRTLKTRLAVRRADKVLVIEVIVTAHTPDKAALLANAIADAYLADQAEARAQAGERASAALSARLDAQRARVETAENAIQAYRQSHDIVTASGQLVGDQKLIELNAQLAAAQSRSAGLRARIDQLDRLRQSRGTADATAEALQSTVIGKLREQEGTLVQRQAELEAQLGPQHPAIGAIRSQLANVRQLIGAELGRITASAQADYERALGDERLVAAQVQQAQAATVALGQASVRLRELERNLEADRTVYAAFLVRAQETREQAGIDTTNARIITRAMPPEEKSWPKLGLLLAGALSSGLGIGGGLALIREYVRPTILGRGQIERALGAPVIAILPAAALAGARRRARRGQDAAPDAPPDAGDPRALAMTGLALRRLFAADASHGPAMRSLLVTSGARDGAARRVVCALFAAAARRRGERVLVIDATTDATTDAGADALAGAAERSLSMHPAAAARDVQTASADGGAGSARLPSEAAGQFDLLIIDGGVLADNLAAASLVAGADQVLLVALLARTAQADALAAADAASLMGGPVSAIILVDPMAAG